jgi:hypothetical protein
MSFPDVSSHWMMYGTGAAASTVLFMALGAGGYRWLHRAATRVGVISALATLFCILAGVSHFRDSSPVAGQPDKIGWCQRVSCSIDEAQTPRPSAPTASRVR